MPYEFGDVVLVPFPFTSQAASKKRPAVVASTAAYNASKPDIVVMAVTSQLRASALLGEVWLHDWQAAHLLKPSAIKPVLATLEQVMVIRQLGHLSVRDRISLKNAISQIRSLVSDELPCSRLRHVLSALPMPADVWKVHASTP